MTKLKRILFNIARLPAADQRWIVRRLSPSGRVLELLQEAQRFRTLNARDVGLPVNPPNLPAFCQQLAMKAPLYAAIVIEQGQYPWTSLFLKRFDTNGAIKMALYHQTTDIKPLVKKALFNEWEATHHFEHYLGDAHG